MSTRDEFIERAEVATTDIEKWAVIRDAWDEYVNKGAGVFDWDYDSRDVMRALSPDHP